MTRGLIPGGTDYAFQSLSDLVDDLEGLLELVVTSHKTLVSSREKLIDNGAWESFLYDFRSIFNYSIKFYDTCMVEIAEINREVQIEVQQHHVRRLATLSKIANKLNVDIGKIWHDNWRHHDYEDPNFQIIHGMYIEGRDMAVGLLDLSNISRRLQDYVGRRNLLPLERGNQSSLSKFRERIEASYNLEEIRTLCQDLGINHENIPGATSTEKARELVEYANRHGLLGKLVEICLRQRPNAIWE